MVKKMQLDEMESSLVKGAGNIFSDMWHNFNRVMFQEAYDWQATMFVEDVKRRKRDHQERLHNRTKIPCIPHNPSYPW